MIVFKYYKRDSIVDENLLKILGCPVDKSELMLKSGKLICKECQRVYGIKDGIPQMLVQDYSCDSSAEK